MNCVLPPQFHQVMQHETHPEGVEEPGIHCFSQRSCCILYVLSFGGVSSSILQRYKRHLHTDNISEALATPPAPQRLTACAVVFVSEPSRTASGQA
jgi:hypothetical protein